jgi:diaphanous 1
MLSKIKLTPADIRKALLEVDDKALSVDDLKAMERQTPTAEEIARLRDFGDVSTLAKADQLFYHVGLTLFSEGHAVMCGLDHGYPQDH